MRSIDAFVAGLSLSIGVALAPAAFGNGIIVDSAGDRGVRGPTPVVLAVHHVTAVLRDRVADVTVDQVFRNRSAAPVEGVYLFPLPEGAVVDHFAMSMGGRMVDGAVLPASEARRVYERIVRRRADPGLLEYAGRGLYRANVFPIAASGEVHVRLTFQQVLPEDAGTLQFRYPLATDRLNGEPVSAVGVDVRIESEADLKAVYCPSHRVTLTRDGERRAHVTWDRRGATQDRDFLLYVGRSADAVGFSLASTGSTSDDGTFLAVLAPRVSVPGAARVPKDVVFVLDTSGSMVGEKLVQAKKAVSMGIELLRPIDRFNVITFATSVRSWREDPSPASADARREARSWLDDREANGGTDIDGALSKALSTRSDGRLLLVVFVTDGLPTVGESRPDAIVAHATAVNRSNARVFTFGVGSDLDVNLLDRVAEGTGGARDYVTGGEDLEIATGRLYGKVEDPVLADVHVDLGPDVYDVYPRRIPDLFAGGQIVLFGRYRKAGPRKVALTGTIEGKALRFEFDGTMRSDAGPDVLPRLWAQRKIAYLLDEIRLHGANAELTQEVERLGTRFAIVTPYTSGLVVDDSEFDGAGATAGPVHPASPHFGGSGQFRGPTGSLPPTSPSSPAPMREPSDPTPPPPTTPEAAPMWPTDPSLPSAPTTPSAPASDPTFYGAKAKRSQDLKRRKDADAVEDTESAAVGTVRRAGGRTFVLDREGRFVDTLFDGKAVTTKVEAFSDAYFALLATGDDIAKFLAVGRRVLFLADGRVYEIVPKAAAPAK